MGKKKKNKISSNKELLNVQNSLKQLSSIIYDPQILSMATSGQFSGIREKVVTINNNVLRNLVNKVPILGIIINHLTAHALQFCKYEVRKGRKGFKFNTANPRKEISDTDDETMFQLAKFYDQTGFSTDGDREDDFSDYISMQVREICTIDQISTELQYNRRGDLVAFWAVDSNTIKRVDLDQKMYDPDVRFIQIVDDKIVNTYTDNLLYDYKNKRVDLRYRGFGYSPIEMMIDTVTTLLFGGNYLRDQLCRDKAPKGYIQILGDVSPVQLDSVRRYWHDSMTGSGGAWNIPILPSGKDGVGIEYKQLNSSNRDMEYHTMMNFLLSIACAIFNINPAELGLKPDDSTAIIGANDTSKLKASKETALGSMLAFLAQHLNKIQRKISTDYVFEFNGLDPEDEAEKADLRKKDLETYKCIDDLCAEEGREPYNAEWSKIPLNPLVVQMVLAKQQAEQAQQMQSQEGGMSGDTGESTGDMSLEDVPPPGEDGLPEESSSDSESLSPPDETGKTMTKSINNNEIVTRIIIQ